MKNSLLFIAILLLAACKAGSGVGLNAQGRPEAETLIIQPDDPIPTDPPVENLDIINATLTSIQTKVFTPICSVCHGGVNPAAGQNLSSIENTIANLINVQSSNPLFKRVLPGSAEQSYLYLKITGNGQSGARMPLGQAALPDDAINAIKEWIEQGATVPSNALTPTQISRVSTELVTDSDIYKNTESKINNETNTNTYFTQNIDHAWVADQQLKITFWFNQNMNFSSLTRNEMLINAKNINNQWTVNNSKISLHVINNIMFSLTIKNLDSSVEKLTITLNNSSISTITSANSQILDGDADGFDGGEFIYELNLQ